MYTRVLISKLTHIYIYTYNYKSMTQPEFIAKEIEEVSKIHQLDPEEINNLINSTKLNSKDLIKIKKLETRSIIYELKTLFPDTLFETKLPELLFNILINMHEKKEKNYLVEKKALNKIKELFILQNENEWNFFYYKLAIIFSRRLVLVFNSNLEYEQTGEIEVSLLIQQITTDLLCYINMLKIVHKKNILISESHIKSFILRVLKLSSELDNKNLLFVLKNLNNKTIYFFISKYSNKLFVHFYSRVFLCPPTIMVWKNLGLNGGFHFLNKRRIIEPNLYNNETEIIPQIIEFVKKQNNIKYYLDEDMIKIQQPYIEEQLIKDKNFNKEWGEYFKTIQDLNTKELNEILNLETYKKKIKKYQYLKKINNEEELEIIKEKMQKKKINEKTLNKLEKKKIYLNKLLSKGIKEWDPKTYNKWMQKDFSYAFIIKIYLDFVNFFEDYKDCIYYAIYFDFRGRFYSNSMTAPSQGWPFRFLYNFGDIEKKDIKAENNNSLIDIKKYETVIQLTEKRIGPLTSEEAKNLIWILISIGNITIKKKAIIKEEEFVNEGINNFLNKTITNDKAEISELNYYYLIIDGLNKKSKNRYLIKDISGSIFQNASLILGIKNSDSLNILNLNGNDWHDPYYPLVKEIQDNVKDELKNFFSRKTLKKSIMTRYYNSKLFTSYNYFITEVRKLNEFKEDLIPDLFNEFKKIYELLKNLEKKTLFENSNEDYNNFLIKNKIETISYEDFTFNIISYKLKAKRIDIVVNGKRLSITSYSQTKIIYKEKTKNSMIPNIFHGEDSNRARMLLTKFAEECICIHDAFGVSYKKIDKLIKAANNEFDLLKKKNFYMHSNQEKINTNEKIFSKFIIL